MCYDFVMEEVYGFIESIVFTEQERGFTVAKLKEPRRNELTWIIGLLPSVQPGETIRCRGSWKHHPEYGKQFEVTSFDLEAPSDVIGIKKYLESGMIKGIGPAYAEKIVKHFGTNTLNVIDQDPDKLFDVPGLGEKKVHTIKECWSQQRSIRHVMIFLRGHGVSPGYAHKIYKAYGEKTIEKVSSNPFLLAKDVFGIGFKGADSVAKGLGIPPDSHVRICAGLEHALWEMSNDGHTCASKELLVQTAQVLLEAPSELIASSLELYVQEGHIIERDDVFWLRPFYFSEQGIAKEVRRLLSFPCCLRAVDTSKAVSWAETQLSIELAPEQKTAVASGVEDKMHIITGGPGTGKSTITKAILRISKKLSSNILLAAPTGRAAKRMSEITGHAAHTIHVLLEMDFTTKRFKRNRENPLPCDLIIIDEASMIDTLLMYNLLKAIPDEARVIFIGDVDQLPSVGPGNILKDLINSGCLKQTTLKQIFRQAAGSRIIVNAHKVNQGEFPDISVRARSDFHFIEKQTPELIAQEIIDLVSTRLPKNYRFHRFEEIQVLSPMKRGVIGTEHLNELLQKKLNHSPNPLMRMGRSFRMGDKVMQIRNNYQKEVYNGDIGIIKEIDLAEQTLEVLFDRKHVSYAFIELDELMLAYAVSIHKYQGSECPCIIIPMHTSHFKLLYRNLLYTGITRGKKLVILVGTKQAIGMAVGNQNALERQTGLLQALTENTYT